MLCGQEYQQNLFFLIGFEDAHYTFIFIDLDFGKVEGICWTASKIKNVLAE